MKTGRILRFGAFQQLLACIPVFLSILYVPASAADTIRLASIFAFSGQAASDNRLSARGVQFAVREINQGGGMLGTQVKLLEYDNRSTPIGAKIAAEQAVSDGVIAIIGCAWSSHSLAVARVAQAHGVPMITNVSTHPEITAIGDFIFRICFTDSFQGWVLANFAIHQLQAETGVVFKDLTSDFSMSLTREIRKTFEGYGGVILEEIAYKHRQENFRGPILKAAARRPDVYFFSGHDESALILKEAHRLGISLLPLGSDGWGSESFFRMSGTTVPIGYYCTHWAEEIDTPRSKDFVRRYKQADQPIYPQEALGYDAVMVLADAVQRAGSVEKGYICNALSQTRSFPGVTGDITFDPQGDPVKPAVMIRVAEGRQDVIGIIHPEINAPSSMGIDNQSP